jgi:DNA-binding IclR family transcriptional regulator
MLNTFQETDRRKMKLGEKKIIQSVHRAIEILTLFRTQDQTELSLTEISCLLSLNKSTVFHLISTLEQSNFVEKTSRSGKYRLGLALFSLGNIVGGQMDLRKQAIPFLKNIVEKFHQTVHLAILDQDQAFYIEKVKGTATIHTSSQVGKYKPLHCTAIGKVLMASLTEDSINRIIKEKGLPRFTPSTICEPEQLKKELLTIREQGYALDNTEIEPELFCVATPIRDHSGEVVAAISISGSLSRISISNSHIYVQELKKVSHEISLSLGYK